MQSSAISLSISSRFNERTARIVMPILDGPKFVKALSDFISAVFGEVTSDCPVHSIRVHSPIRLYLCSSDYEFESNEALVNQLGHLIIKEISQSFHQSMDALCTLHPDPTEGVRWLKSVLGKYEKAVGKPTQTAH